MASSPATSSSASTLRVGVLILPPDVQLLDMSPVDLFHMCNRGYLEACGLPGPLLSLGLDVAVSYISALPAGSSLKATGSLTFLSTASLSDSAVQPGALDILLVPGPPPDRVPTSEESAFLRAHSDADKTDILTVCTGVFPAGYAGVLDGKEATAPRGLLPKCRKLFPSTSFRDDVRWVHDGRLWTSGGITNGQEMVAAYLRHRFPGPLSNVVCALSDCGEKTHAYATTTTADTGWFVWQIVRSLWTTKKVK